MALLNKCEIFFTYFKGTCEITLWSAATTMNIITCSKFGWFYKSKMCDISSEFFLTVLDGRVQSDDECFSSTLENILQFATGATYPPPLGFGNNPQIGFAHDSAVTLPTANTCSPKLTLPTANADVETFKRRMTYAFFNSVGFGHV